MALVVVQPVRHHEPQQEDQPCDLQKSLSQYSSRAGLRPPPAATPTDAGSQPVHPAAAAASQLQPG